MRSSLTYNMVRRFSRILLALVLLLSYLPNLAGQTCRRVITQTVLNSGTATQVQNYESAMGRLDKMFKAGLVHPEAWDVVGKDIVDGLVTGARPLDPSTIHMWVQYANNGNIADAELAVVVTDIGSLRNSSGKFPEGLFNSSDTKFSSSWVTNADTGNRGFSYEPHVAADLVRGGQVSADDLVFGRTLQKADGSSALIEGDLFVPSKDLWIDTKLSNGNFTTDELDRIELALNGGGLNGGKITSFQFVIEGGIQNAPSTWVSHLNDINGRLQAAGLNQITVVTGLPFP